MPSERLSTLANLANGNHKEIITYFGKADDAIKIISDDYKTDINGINVRLNIDLARNEIRFAGNHVVRAIYYSDSGDNHKHDLQIEEAIVHCKRAIIFCFEYGIRDKINRFNLYETSYPVTIKDSVDGYSDDLSNKSLAEELIKSADVANQHCQHDKYGDFEDIYIKLRKSVQKIKGAEVELQKRTRDKKNRHRLAISTLIVAVLAAFSGYLNYFEKSSHEQNPEEKHSSITNQKP